MTRPAARALGLLAPFLLVGCDPPPAPSPPAQPPLSEITPATDAPTAAIASVRAYLEDYAAKRRGALNVPALSVAVTLPDGATVATATGWADPELNIRATPETHFMSGSTGKTFCAALVMALVEQGKLHLDDRLAPLFADEPWFAKLPNGDALTLRMLLNHTEGFPQFLDLTSFSLRYGMDLLLGRDLAYSPRMMESFIEGEAPLNAPGAAYHYSDLGYDLAGLAIEKATGRSYWDLMRDLILKPQGYDEIAPNISTRLPHLAAGYAEPSMLTNILGLSGRVTDKDGALKQSPALEYAGGGLNFPPRALARFYFDLMHNRIVSAESIAAMTAPGAPVPANPPAEAHYGFGLFIVKRPGLGTYVTHSGYYPGYSTQAAYFPAMGIAIALQVNRDHIDVTTETRDLAMGVARAAGITLPP